MTIFAKPNWEPGMPDNEPKSIPIAEVDFLNLPANNPDQAFIIGSPLRPGFTPFVVEVEYSLYLPDTPKNKEFELLTSAFPPGANMLWFTIAVPMVDLDKVRDIAKKYEFEFEQDSIPICIDENGTHSFPLGFGPNVFTVSGGLQDEQLVEKYWNHWQDVIDKHEHGLPWK